MSADFNWDSMDLEGLITAIAATQDRTAFVTLFERFGPKVKAYLLRTGCSSTQAEELVQETMLAIWRKAGQFDQGRSLGMAWLFAIARNLRIDALRRERTVECAMLDEPADEQTPHEWLASNEAYSKLQAALAQLPPEQVEVVRAAFIEHRAHSEISEHLGCPWER